MEAATIVPFWTMPWLSTVVPPPSMRIALSAADTPCALDVEEGWSGAFVEALDDVTAVSQRRNRNMGDLDRARRLHRRREQTQSSAHTAYPDWSSPWPSVCLEMCPNLQDV